MVEALATKTRSWENERGMAFTYDGVSITMWLELICLLSLALSREQYGYKYFSLYYRFPFFLCLKNTKSYDMKKKKSTKGKGYTNVILNALVQLINHYDTQIVIYFSDCKSKRNFRDS